MSFEKITSLLNTFMTTVNGNVINRDVLFIAYSGYFFLSFKEVPGFPN